MDINILLFEMRMLSKEIIEEDATPEERAEQAAQLAEKLLALDAWIVKGGFLPERWESTVRVV